jgi:hypothetical protein
MFAVEAQEVVNSDVQSQAVTEVFLSHGFGVSFLDDNSVAQNGAVLEALERIGAVEPGDIVKDNGLTSFTVNAVELAQFLHLVYCSTPEGKKLVVEFDGLFPFQSYDTSGVSRNFNAQLITISEQTVQ